MLMILQIFNTYYKQFLVIIAALFGYFLVKKNKELKIENEKITLIAKDNEKTIDIQQVIMDDLRNFKDDDIAGNIRRMRNKEL